MGRKIEFVGAAEIGTMLGVGRQRVSQLTARPDFPRPYQALAMGKIWRRDAVEQWQSARAARLDGRAHS